MIRNLTCFLILLATTKCSVLKPTAADCEAYKVGQFVQNQYTTRPNHVPKVTRYMLRNDSIQIVMRKPFMDTTVNKITWLAGCRYKLEPFTIQPNVSFYLTDGVGLNVREVQLNWGEEYQIKKVTNEYAIVKSSNSRDTIWKVKNP